MAAGMPHAGQLPCKMLAISTTEANTSSGKLFLQIERQASNNIHLCCFPSADAANVTLRLGNMEELLKKYVPPSKFSTLFREPTSTLRFSGQVAPIKNGKPKIPRLDVPEYTATYANHALTRLYAPKPKR